MYALVLNLAAIAVYIAATGYLFTLIRHQKPITGPWLHALPISAIGFHWAGLYPLLVSVEGINFSFFATANLVSATMNTLLFISGLRKPLQSLYALLMPVAVICIAMLLITHQPQHFSKLNEGLALHVILSLLAYSFLTIATAQALLLARQTHQLRHNQTSGTIKLLPPLQTMEALLFELLWLGFIILSASIVTGIGFIEDLFAQHLAHKTVFSVIAWLIYAALLAGRHWLGWRGNTAIRFTLGGFAALMLAFFGSKFVLELLLQRT